MPERQERTRTGTFAEFKEFTLAVVRGERQVDPNEPKIWIETPDGDGGSGTRRRAGTAHAGSGLLSDGNRERSRKYRLR